MLTFGLASSKVCITYSWCPCNRLWARLEFYDFFCRRHSLIKRLCYKNLFQFMQHDNFRNLNRLILTHWYFPVIKRFTFHYLMKSAPIPGNQGSFEILQLFDIWRYQSLVVLFFSYLLNLIWDESVGVCLV